jgi:hypothetical protein
MVLSSNIIHNWDTPPINPNGMYDGVRSWRIPSNRITMRGVPFNVLAKTDNGIQVIMQPEMEYYFQGATYVDEYPLNT